MYTTTPSDITAGSENAFEENIASDLDLPFLLNILGQDPETSFRITIEPNTNTSSTQADVD